MGTCQTLDLVSTPTTSSSTCWKKFRRLGSQPQQNWWKSTVSLILGRPFKLIFRWRSSTTRSATGWTWQKGNTTVISVERPTHGRLHLTSILRSSTRCIICAKQTQWQIMVQDGEGDGDMSRKGTSVIHYDQQFREEVVAFAKTTSRKEAKERYKDFFHAIPPSITCNRFDLSESTIRMWLRKADGLDYRGPSYNRAHADRIRFQGTLQVPPKVSCFTSIPAFFPLGHCPHSWLRIQEFLVDAPEDIKIEPGPSK